MTRHPRPGLLALALVATLFAAACGEDGGTTTTVPEASPTVPETTGTTAPTTTTASGGTTTTATTPSTTTITLPAFPGDTDPKTGTGGIGLLTGVRFGDHEDHVRVVFDFQEPSFPHWEIGYVPGEIHGMLDPGGGWVEGEAYLVARFTPAGTADLREAEPVVTYHGPRRIDVGLGSVVQLLIIEDFEANLWWVIGLTGEKPFRVGTMTGPPRIYVDIAD
ncbi:MAG: hypothetical protein ABIJ48_08465 [Actinomycetota bacterium]